MIAVVLGVRPEIVKLAPFVAALRRHVIEHVVVYTNQHWLDAMSTQCFDQFGYRPDVTLPQPFSPGAAIAQLIATLGSYAVTQVVVQGDTTSTFMGALAGLYHGCPVVHLEAGLRSYDREMLEERHRCAIDHMADLLLTYTDEQADRLREEQVGGEIVVVGHPLVDLLSGIKIIPASRRPYLFVTLHRRELVDDRDRWTEVVEAVRAVARRLGLAVLWPVHPRVVDRVGCGLGRLPGPPVAPLDPWAALAAIRGAALVLTDSGGVQEEAALLGTPCVTIRPTTERPETVRAGMNLVTGYDGVRILEAAVEMVERPHVPQALYGEPGSGERMLAAVLAAKLYRPVEIIPTSRHEDGGRR